MDRKTVALATWAVVGPFVAWHIRVYESEITVAEKATLRWLQDPVTVGFMTGVLFCFLVLGTAWWFMRWRMVVRPYCSGTRVESWTNGRGRKVLAVRRHICPDKNCGGGIQSRARKDNNGQVWFCPGTCGLVTGENQYAPHGSGDFTALISRLEPMLSDGG